MDRFPWDAGSTMKVFPLLIFAALSCISIKPVASVKALFSGDFIISNVFVDTSPPPTYGALNQSSYIYFDFTDQDTLHLPPTPCLVYWPKSSTPGGGTALCANGTFTVNVPDETYLGAKNFAVELSHTYIDNSIGEYPYNILTKFGGLNLTFPGTLDYDCELVKGKCWSKTGSSFLAIVTGAIS